MSRSLISTLFGSLMLSMLVVLGTACSDDDVGGVRALPTAEPAPTIAGRVVEAFAPGEYDDFVVVGLGMADGLPMHLFPGIDKPVTIRIPSAAEGIVGLGNAFETPDGRIWWHVKYSSRQGWIEPGAAYVGASEIVSVEAAGRLDRSVYATATELALAVADQYLGDPGAEAVIIASEPASGPDPAVVVVDITGAADDSMVGHRVEVVARTDAPGEYRLARVTETLLCGRGITDDGLCR